MGRKSLSLIHPNPDEVIEITFGKLQKRKSHQSSNLLIDNDMHVDICETIYVAIKRSMILNLRNLGGVNTFVHVSSEQNTRKNL